MTEASINYLSTAARQSNNSPGGDRFIVWNQVPFLQHAADHWGDYAALAWQYPGFEDVAQKIIKSLKEEYVTVALGELVSPDSQAKDFSCLSVVEDRDYPRPLGGQHLLAYFGLDTLLRVLINKDKMKEEKATEQVKKGEKMQEHDGGRTPLSWAAQNGHLECVKIL